MDMEGLSVICAGLGMAEEDQNGNRIGYSKGEYCLGKSPKSLNNFYFDFTRKCLKWKEIKLQILLNFVVFCGVL